MTQRTERIDELLRQEIGAIIAREIADPRIGFVTITKVETAPDLSHARVWVSSIGSPEERTATLRALGRAMPFIRHELASRVTLRRVPDLHLRADDTLERGTRVLRLISELEAGADPAAITDADPILPTPVRRLPHEGDAPDDPAMPPPPPSAARPSRRRRDAGRTDGRPRSAGHRRPRS